MDHPSKLSNAFSGQRVHWTPAAPSRHRGANREPFIAPAAVSHDPGQAVDCIPNIDIARVKRSETKAQNIGSAEVAYHAQRYQRLNDFVSVAVAERDLAASRARLAWAGDFEIGTGTTCLDKRKEQVAQAPGLVAHIGHGNAI